MNVQILRMRVIRSDRYPDYRIYDGELSADGLLYIVSGARQLKTRAFQSSLTVRLRRAEAHADGKAKPVGPQLTQMDPVVRAARPILLARIDAEEETAPPSETHSRKSSVRPKRH